MSFSNTQLAKKHVIIIITNPQKNKKHVIFKYAISKKHDIKINFMTSKLIL